jgi:hypothetical protein
MISLAYSGRSAHAQALYTATTLHTIRLWRAMGIIFGMWYLPLDTYTYRYYINIY